MSEDILKNLEASVALAVQEKQASEGSQELVDYNEKLQQRVNAPTERITSIADDAIGYGVGSKIGGTVANALTPQLQREAMKRGATKLAPWLARHAAPRLLAGTLGTLGGGPVGTAIGLVAPELGYQAINALQSLPQATLPTATPQAQYTPAMDMVAAQNPQLVGTPEILSRAMQGPGVGYNPEASQYSTNFLQLP